MHTWGIQVSIYEWVLNIEYIFTLPMPYKIDAFKPVYYTHMSQVRRISIHWLVTTSSSDWARDLNWINTTKYDWPGLYYTRLGQTTINFNGTRLYTTTIIQLAPSWHISHHGLHTCMLHIIRTYWLTCRGRSWCHRWSNSMRLHDLWWVYRCSQ
jgi:hypothetical protein